MRQVPITMPANGFGNLSVAVLRALLLCLWLPACLDITDSNDAGTGGTGSGSGTQLAGNCTATFTACGGDVTGTWALQSICAQSSLTDAVNTQYTSGPDCGSVCTSASLTASGTVTYASPSVSSSESFQFVESLAFGDVCFGELKGTTLSDSTCQTGGSDFAGSASCALSLSTCICQASQTITDSVTTYAISGNDIVEYGPNNPQGLTIEYCVTGNTMTQRRSLPNLPPGLNFIVQFTRS